ncbi:type II secretion system F family protein [Marinomonas algarum]|uniref:Type II secretion system F family protein n=1 Tax=Marinomonas algarum TaxID=2883105 RepID=A0A9X1IQP9_9GAMM|nr:type II secretion system F family protein [Marinomonas algarum]MCB5162771.1 type II secretion system F family protein [Marinomonas algarum]
MPWYHIKLQGKTSDYRYADEVNTLFYEYAKQGLWHLSATRWHPKKFDYKSLNVFYKELQSALGSGLQLNEALEHFSSSNSHKNMGKISQALLSELEYGVSFNNALSKLTLPLAQPYCYLLNANGTREDCDKSLSLSISQLDSLLNWSQRLLKALIYPFSIMQIALLILIANRALQSTSDVPLFIQLIGDSVLYTLFSFAQLLTINSLNKGGACYWLERFSQNFRLTKLFSLLSTTRATGITLQQAVKTMSSYFQHEPTKREILGVYYTLKLGKHYSESFPPHWFPRESAIALHSAEQDGDIERALTLAESQHERQWQSNIALLEKLIPALCLIIAGGVVASALVTLYAPLMEVP